MANTDAKFILTISAIVLKGHWAKLLKPNIVSFLSSATIHQNAQHLLEKIAHRDFLSTPSVLNALVKVHDDPAGNSHVLSWLTDKVWKVYKKMVRLGVVANIHVYNVLLHACCKSGDMGSAMKVKNKMLEAGLKLDQYTYKALIHGFCKVQEMDSAKELLFGMLDAGFAPSYCTYCWLVDGYCKKCNDEAVIKLLDEFVGRGVCVDISVYRALIRRFCKIEKVDCAQRVFSLMQENDISGDSVIYTSLAYAYWRAGKANATLDMLEEMYKRRACIASFVAIGHSMHGLEPADDGMFLLEFFLCQKSSYMQILCQRRSTENVTIYYKALIHGFCKVQEVDSAKELLFGLLVPVFPVIGLIHGLLMVAATNAIKKH
ncbi:hypothetical protein Pint_18875 [Pistacia integerrima]|uniref:Uncharacterized protein n=1 Tax=Pistacia integerrima TaxID=434235 RepID=A0ACC0YVQ0_9ROSI|nr:hypothetical protein Pint_18875 [Pistacia integerrima]